MDITNAVGVFVVDMDAVVEVEYSTHANLPIDTATVPYHKAHA